LVKGICVTGGDKNMFTVVPISMITADSSAFRAKIS
jgi:hypothetical protein